MVMLPEPTPTLTSPAPDTFNKLLKVPAELSVVLPSAVIETSEVSTAAAMVMLGLVLFWERVMFEPAIRPNAEEDAVLTVPRLVPPATEPAVYKTDWLGTEMVTLPAPTPTEAIPAPEKFKRLVKVPAELEVVFPSAVNDPDTV